MAKKESKEQNWIRRHGTKLIIGGISIAAVAIGIKYKEYLIQWLLSLQKSLEKAEPSKYPEESYFCYNDYEDDQDDYEEENLSVYDAADIWLSSGKDEDYMFGYTEQELEDAL